MTDEVRTHYGDDTPLDARWYVVHTYSGYENKVKEDLEKTIENRNLQDLILEVKYPTEQVTELKEGSKKPKTVLRKVYPGYVMVKMVMNDNTWYIVRNTRGVTGFVGPEASRFPSPMRRSRQWALNVCSLSWISKSANTSALSDAVCEFHRYGSGNRPRNAADSPSSFPCFGKETPIELDFVEVQKL